ncbi:MAG: DUF192 domain-containing protein [Oleiharenicola lentus]
MFSRRHFLPLFAAVCVLLAGCGHEAKQAPAPKTVEDRFAIKVGGQLVQMQLAILPQEMQQGLMYRKSMGADEGMVFIYDRPQQMSFWMRNCEFPQDIGFFDPDGKLKEVYPMYPHDERPVQSLGVRQFALEMNQGWYRQHRLQAGDEIDLAALADAIRARGMRPEDYRLK